MSGKRVLCSPVVFCLPFKLRTDSGRVSALWRPISSTQNVGPWYLVVVIVFDFPFLFSLVFSPPLPTL